MLEYESTETTLDVAIETLNHATTPVSKVRS
jgi:hypothetical protein